MEDDDTQPPPKGLSHWQSISKYQRIVNVLQCVGCRHYSPTSGEFCDCFLYLKSFGHCGLFDEVSASADSSSTSISEQLKQQVDCLKRVQCRRCNHSAGDHLKMISDLFDDAETFEVFQLGSDINRLKNYVEFEREPLARRVYRFLHGVYRGLLYASERKRNLWPYSMTNHYRDPPFETPSIEYLIYNVVYYFNKPNTDQMNIMVKCAKYFLQYLNNWELPRLDSEFYKRMPRKDQNLYRAFYELWLVYCYVPSMNSLLKKFSVSRIFGARMLFMILSQYIDSFRAHLESIANEDIPGNEELVITSSDFETFLLTIEYQVTGFENHLVHNHYLNAEFALIYDLKLCNSPLFREKNEVQFCERQIHFIKLSSMFHHGFNDSHCKVQSFLFETDAGNEVDLRKAPPIEDYGCMGAMTSEMLRTLITGEWPRPNDPGENSSLSLSADAEEQGFLEEKSAQFEMPDANDESSASDQELPVISATSTTNGELQITNEKRTTVSNKRESDMNMALDSIVETKENVDTGQFDQLPVSENVVFVYSSLPSAPVHALSENVYGHGVEHLILNSNDSITETSSPRNTNGIGVDYLFLNGDESVSSGESFSLPSSRIELSNGRMLDDQSDNLSSNSDLQVAEHILEGDEVSLNLDEHFESVTFSLTHLTNGLVNNHESVHLASVLNEGSEHIGYADVSRESRSYKNLQILTDTNGDVEFSVVDRNSPPYSLFSWQSNISPSAVTKQCSSHSNLASQNPNIAALLSSDSNSCPSSLSPPETDTSPSESPKSTEFLSIRVHLSPSTSSADQILNENLLSPERNNNSLNKSMFINPKRSVSPKNKLIVLARSPSSSSLLSPIASPTSKTPSSFKNCICTPTNKSGNSPTSFNHNVHEFEASMVSMANLNGNHAVTLNSTPVRISQPDSPSEASGAPSSLKRDHSPDLLLSEWPSCSTTKSRKKKSKKRFGNDRDLQSRAINAADSTSDNGKSRNLPATYLTGILNEGSIDSNSNQSLASSGGSSRSAASSHYPVLVSTPTKQVTGNTSGSNSPSPSVSRRLFANSPAKSPSGSLTDTPRSPGKGRSPDGRRVTRTLNLRHRKVVLTSPTSAMGGLLSLINNGTPTKRCPCKKAASASGASSTSTNGHEVLPNTSILDFSSDSTVIMSEVESGNEDDLNGSENGESGSARQGSESSSSYGDSNIENDVFMHIKAAHLHADNLSTITDPEDHNDTTKRKILLFLELQNVISNQLPNMGIDYINKIIFKPGYRSILLIKNKRVIGGFTFRPFEDYNFTEVIFCAITSREQVKGYGTIMMNLLKEHCVKNKIYRLLTYADNFALEFFRKRGFTKTITVPKIAYEDNITLCSGADLMECKIDPDFRCPTHYGPIFQTEWIDEPDPTLIEIQAASEEASKRKSNGTNSSAESKRTRRNEASTSSGSASNSSCETPDTPPAPKKRGRKPRSLTPNKNSNHSANNGNHHNSNSNSPGPSDENWKRLDDFLKAFTSQTGSGIFRQPNNKISGRFQYAVCLEEVRRLHDEKKHYHSIRMLYYDLMTMVRGFQYTFKKNSAAYKTSYRLERFLKKSLKDGFAIDETV